MSKSSMRREESKRGRTDAGDSVALETLHAATAVAGWTGWEAVGVEVARRRTEATVVDGHTEPAIAAVPCVAHTRRVAGGPERALRVGVAHGWHRGARIHGHAIPGPA